MLNRFALALVISALPLAALSGQSRFRQPAAAPQNQSQIRFADMDVNGDGVITRREWRGSAQGFDNADWNRDGILSGDEVRPAGTRTPRARSTSAAEAGAARFRSLDYDQNGFVSRWEWPDSWQSFSALDRNGDDVLTPSEVTSGAVDDNFPIAAGPVAEPRSAGTTGDIVRVDPKERWTDTGLDVYVGDRVYFDAEGTLQLSIGGPDTSTPEGSTSGRRAANAPLPRASAGALLARIGDSAPLLIGARRTIARAPVSGRLYLGVNDDHLPDNSGEYRVSVTIEGR
jgi:hypothetical protein